MLRIIDARALVIDVLYYNQVQLAPFWYMPSETRTVVQGRHIILKTGSQLLPINSTNKLPMTCNIAVAMQQKAVMVACLNHYGIMGLMRCDVIESNIPTRQYIPKLASYLLVVVFLSTTGVQDTFFR